MYIFVIEDLDL